MPSLCTCPGRPGGIPRSERSYYRLAAGTWWVKRAQIPRILQQIVLLYLLEHRLLLLQDLEHGRHDKHKAEAWPNPKHLASELLYDLEERVSHVCKSEKEAERSLLPRLGEEKISRSSSCTLLCFASSLWLSMKRRKIQVEERSFLTYCWPSFARSSFYCWDSPLPNILQTLCF